MRALFLLLVLLGAGGALHCGTKECEPVRAPPSLAFRRQVFDSEKRRELTLYLHALAEETPQMHCLLVFGFHSERFHSALIVNPLKQPRIGRVARDCEYVGECELLVHAKDGVVVPLQYEVAPLQHFATTVVVNSLTRTRADFDALLSLDPASSLWAEYNTVTFDQALLVVSRRDEPPDGWALDQERDREDFRGVYRLRCDPRRQHRAEKHCVVALRGHEVNGRGLDGAQLVLDLSAQVNLLPYDLFMRWQFHDEKELWLHPAGVAPEARSRASLFHINRQFKFQLNERSGDIVLGVDVVHHFQKVELAHEFGYVTLWYASAYHERARHEQNTAIIFLFISLVLTTISYWCSSPNFDVAPFIMRKVFAPAPKPPKAALPAQHLPPLVRETSGLYALFHSGLFGGGGSAALLPRLGAEKRPGTEQVAELETPPPPDQVPLRHLQFEFPYKIVATELVALLTTLILWILIFTFTDELSSAHFGPHSHSVFQQRKLIIVCLQLYHAVLSTLIFIYTRELLVNALWHYYAKVRFFLFARELDDNYAMLKKWAAQESELAPVKLVLLRNLTCHTLANTNFLLIVNYLAEEKALYQIPFIIAALALLYCYVKTLFTALLFLCAYKYRPLRLLRKEAAFCALMLASALVFFLDFGFSVWPFYVAFFSQLNNFFPREAVLSLTATLLCLVAAGALLSIYDPMTKHLHHLLFHA